MGGLFRFSLCGWADGEEYSQWKSHSSSCVRLWNYRDLRFWSVVRWTKKLRSVDVVLICVGGIPFIIQNSPLCHDFKGHHERYCSQSNQWNETCCQCHIMLGSLDLSKVLLEIIQICRLPYLLCVNYYDGPNTTTFEKQQLTTNMQQLFSPPIFFWKSTISKGHKQKQ